jgi:hypothetical protein
MRPFLAALTALFFNRLLGRIRVLPTAVYSIVVGNVERIGVAAAQGCAARAYVTDVMAAQPRVDVHVESAIAERHLEDVIRCFLVSLRHSALNQESQQ